MKPQLTLYSVLLLGTLAGGCATGAHWSNADALSCDKLEVTMDAHGTPREIEYHIQPDQVPTVVPDAMDRLHPGGQVVAAEKEWDGKQLCWELSKEIGGFEVEAMFFPDGRLHSEEVQVAATSIPAAVRTTAEGHLGGQVNHWEEIRDGDRKLVEFHVKKTADGKDYKLRVSKAGVLLETYREVVAEIEVRVEP